MLGHHINFPKNCKKGNTPEVLYYSHIPHLVYQKTQLEFGLGLGHGSWREKYSGYLALRRHIKRHCHLNILVFNAMTASSQ